MHKGKLVVLEGSDGAGKTTQLELLKTYLKTHHIPHQSLDFPQYYKTFFGKWIGRFLKGEFGRVEDLSPYLVMFPYAADRWQARDDMEQWLDEGKIVLSNRYTGSNAYQAAKLPKSARARYISMAFEMEYEAFGIPREDLVIYLYVPYEISQKLIEAKSRRKYLGNGAKKDIHESNERLMREVESVYLDFCKKYRHWVKVDCTRNGEIMSKEEIHEKVVEVLRKKKIIEK